MDKDHLEIILEDINSKFDLVLEGHQVLQRQIEGAREEAREATQRLEFKIDVVNLKVDRLEKRVDRLEQRFDGLEQRFDGLEQRFDGLEKKVDGLALELAEHRRDTEAHGGVYRVKEG